MSSRSDRRAAVGISVVLIVVTSGIGAVGCSDDVRTTPIATTIGGDRVCRMLSVADVRTVAGGGTPEVRRQNVNIDPTNGWLLDAACFLDAGDVSTSVTVDWVSRPADRMRVRAELSNPADPEVKRFPTSAGVGFVRVVRSDIPQVSGSLLRGQYRIDVTLARGPEARDSLADAEALALQASDALDISVDENAPRPKAPSS